MSTEGLGHLGCCRYCGQTKMIEVTEDLKAEYPDEVKAFLAAESDNEEEEAADVLASITCRCKEGCDMRAYHRRLKDCTDKIEAMFRENYPEIADALQETKTAVMSGDILKITITDTMTGGVASMFMKKDRLKIRWKKPVEWEIEAG